MYVCMYDVMNEDIPSGGARSNSFETIFCNKLIKEESWWSGQEGEAAGALGANDEVAMSPARAIVRTGVCGHLKLAGARYVLIFLVNQPTMENDSREEKR